LGGPRHRCGSGLCGAGVRAATPGRATGGWRHHHRLQIQGNVRSEVETIRSYLQLKEGQAYDPPPPTVR